MQLKKITDSWEPSQQIKIAATRQVENRVRNERRTHGALDWAGAASHPMKIARAAAFPLTCPGRAAASPATNVIVDVHRNQVNVY